MLDDDRIFRCRLHHPDGRGGLITEAQEDIEERWPEEQPPQRGRSLAMNWNSHEQEQT